jgi:hypothetical protein
MPKKKTSLELIREEQLRQEKALMEQREQEARDYQECVEKFAPLVDLWRDVYKMEINNNGKMVPFYSACESSSREIEDVETFLDFAKSDMFTRRAFYVQTQDLRANFKKCFCRDGKSDPIEATPEQLFKLFLEYVAMRLPSIKEGQA